MSVLVKGMEIPKSCRDCGIEQEGFWCGALDGYQNTRCFTNERREDCPLVPVPEHGRLIEADALIDYCKHFAEVFKSSSLPTDKARRDELLGVIGEIINAPTIIPAEEDET